MENTKPGFAELVLVAALVAIGGVFLYQFNKINANNTAFAARVEASNAVVRRIQAFPNIVDPTERLNELTLIWSGIDQHWDILGNNNPSLKADLRTSVIAELVAARVDPKIGRATVEMNRRRAGIPVEELDEFERNTLSAGQRIGVEVVKRLK